MRLLNSFCIVILCINCNQHLNSNNDKNNLKQIAEDSSHPGNVLNYLNKDMWNSLFPHRYGIGIKDTVSMYPDFYSFDAFITATRAFPLFLAEGDTDIQKRELAAFLANISQETSGGWAAAPGGYFKWGLYFVEEAVNAKSPSYVDTINTSYLPVLGKSYHGRGPKQLTWNYNYGQFSKAWYGSKDTLLNHPELVSSDPVLAFASALWFWMTKQPPKPSCHEIMTGKWEPDPNDIQKGRTPGFGATVNVINGGVECGKDSTQPQTTNRYLYYYFFCKIFHVIPGENVTCATQRPFGQ